MLRYSQNRGLHTASSGTIAAITVSGKDIEEWIKFIVLWDGLVESGKGGRDGNLASSGKGDRDGNLVKGGRDGKPAESGKGGRGGNLVEVVGR